MNLSKALGENLSPKGLMSRSWREGIHGKGIETEAYSTIKRTGVLAAL